MFDNAIAPGGRIASACVSGKILHCYFTLFNFFTRTPSEGCVDSKENK